MFLEFVCFWPGCIGGNRAICVVSNHAKHWNKGRVAAGKNLKYLLISLFLPLRYQIGIPIIILQEPVEQLFGDRLFLLELVDISRSFINRGELVISAPFLRRTKRKLVHVL